MVNPLFLLIFFHVVFYFLLQRKTRCRFYSHDVPEKEDLETVNKAKALINKHQGIKKTYELASLHAEKAIHALSIFENSVIKESLVEVANVSLSRLN